MIYIKPLKNLQKKGDVYSRPCANQTQKKSSSSTYTLGTSAMLPFKASTCRRVAVGVQHPTTKEPFKRRDTPMNAHYLRCLWGWLLRVPTFWLLIIQTFLLGVFVGAVGMLEFGDWWFLGDHRCCRNLFSLKSAGNFLMLNQKFQGCVSGQRHEFHDLIVKQKTVYNPKKWKSLGKSRVSPHRKLRQHKKTVTSLQTWPLWVWW